MFFYELEHKSWGMEANDDGSSVVIYETGEAGLAVEPDDLPKDARFPAYPIQFSLSTSLPSDERLQLDWKGMTKAENLAVEAAIEALQPPEPVHQIAGFPHPVQADAMEEQCESVTRGLHRKSVALATTEPAPSAADWRLLFQIDTDDNAGLMWGDTGILYFWVREQDARAGDFSKIWTILQCY